MGKEVTIGLAVVLILMVTFGVVLARRLGGDAEAPETAATDERSTDFGDGNPDAGEPAPLPSAGTSELRIVTAKPATAEPERYSPAAIDQFSTVAVGVVEEPASAAVVDVPPPPMMPNPSAANWTSLDSGYSGDTSGIGGAQSSPLHTVSNDVPTSGADAFDPFPPQADPVATAYVGPVDYQPAALQTYEPPAPAPQPSSSDYGYAGATSYPASGGMSASQTPTWRQEPASAYATQASPPITPIPETNRGREPVYDIRNADGSYTVQPNDNFWRISEKLFGSGAYFKALAEHNREQYPQEDRLDVGDLVMAPSVVELERAYPDLCPKPSRREAVRNRASLVSTPAVYGRRTYVVEEGDTLFDIARYTLGKASRWSEILELNRDLVGDDPSYITPGMTLILPGDDEPTDRLTQRPDIYTQETIPRYR